jgi:hypothetical protein
VAATPTAMFRGALTTTTTTTLGTVTTGKKWIVTNIVVTNTTASPVTATLALDGTALLSARTVNANDTLAFDLKQVLDSTKTITGGASVGSSGVTCHISGVEV